MKNKKESDLGQQSKKHPEKNGLFVENSHGNLKKLEQKKVNEIATLSDKGEKNTPPKAKVSKSNQLKKTILNFSLILNFFLLLIILLYLFTPLLDFYIIKNSLPRFCQFAKEDGLEAKICQELD